MRNTLLLATAVLLGRSGPAHGQVYGAEKLRAVGDAYSYPAVAYSQRVVSNPSTAFNNVVNLHWKRGAGTSYVVLAGRYLQRGPYDGIFPTPSPPYAPAPGGPGNGLMDANSRLPGYAASYEVAPYLIKTGDYLSNPADTTAQVLNALPGETYYAYIWEYVEGGGLVSVLSPPPGSNLSWQSLFTQFHAPPRITSVVLDAQHRPVISWTTAAEDTVAGFRILRAADPGAPSGTLSGAGSSSRLSAVTPTGFSQGLSSYSQTLPEPVTSLSYFQVSQFLTNNSTFVTGEPFWSNIVAVSPPPLPVTLVSFTAQRRAAGQADVRLVWVTATEQNNQGFRLERSLDGTAWAARAFVSGNGTSAALNTYLLLDSCRTAAYYRLVQLDFNGRGTYGPVRYVSAAAGLSPRLSLFPTPASGRVTLLNADPDQPLFVFNVMGQQLCQLSAGTSSFDATGWPRGMYFVRQGSQLAKLLLH